LTIDSSSAMADSKSLMVASIVSTLLAGMLHLAGDLSFVDRDSHLVAR
jgi:hypothetical protein